MGSRSSTHSYLKKTVTLHDWWLIKPETDNHTKHLGVAGITSTSKQNWTTAARSFTSAPIAKVFDMFELETVDNVCIILKGFINKDRTLQNGFSPQVFKHFVFGFPVYWEEFAVTCPKRGSTVSQEGKDSVEGHDVFHACEDYFVDPKLKDCQDTSDQTTTLQTTESSGHIVNTGDEVLSEKTPVTLEVEDDPCLVMNLMGIDVDGIKHNVVKKSEDSSKCLVASSRRMTRSMRKKDISKSQLLLSHDIFSLDKVIHVDPVNIASTDILRTEKNEELTNNKAVDSGAMSESMKNIPKVSDGPGKESNGSASCSEDTVRSKRKQDQYVDEDIRNKLTSQVGQEKNKKDTDDVSGDFQIQEGRSYLGEKRFKSECLKSPTPTSSIENFNIASTVSNVNDEPPKTNMKACQNKKKNKKEEIPAAHRIDSKKAIMTRSRSKSKVTPQREIAKRQPLITTPKPTQRAKKAYKDPYGSPNIVSPEDFSGKKSRSGRVLLPSLEFWRNQKVVYDKDHQVYGIQEPM